MLQIKQREELAKRQEKYEEIIDLGDPPPQMKKLKESIKKI